MTHYKPLGVLDTYARCLTHKQACRLYEAKNHKKPSKALFESIQPVNLYTFHIDSYTIAQIIGDEPGSVADCINDQIYIQSQKTDFTGKYNKAELTDDGVDYKTDSKEDYLVVVGLIRDLYPELNEDDSFMSRVDPELQYLF